MRAVNDFLSRESLRVNRLAEVAAERMRSVPGAWAVEQLVRAYGQDQCSVLAAALSYYTLLSFFPLLLFIVALFSPFVQSTQVIRELNRFVGIYLPAGIDFVRSSLQEVEHLRGPLTLAAAGGFLWSASGVFRVIQLGLNRAFGVQHPLPLWRERVISLSMVIGISVLFGLSFLFTTVFRLAIHYQWLPRHNFLIDTLPPFLTTALGIVTFGLLYRYVPYKSSIRWKDVWLAAVLAAALWEVAKFVFAWYVANLALLNLVYGSLGTVVALMIWAFVTASILLAGAELAAISSGLRQQIQGGNAP